MQPRLSLTFKNGELNFYACSVRMLEGDLDKIYDWSADVMSDKWNPKAAKKKLLAEPNTMVCDALLDQDIFAGSGNIIKNEVLFRIRVHPKAKIGGHCPRASLMRLIKEVRNYSFDFLKWKKAFTLRKHWLVHTRTTCPRCNIPIIKEYMGTHNRRTFFCEKCQMMV